ncbi:hypothetical protein HU200_015382 [Digitaria exilis]|uniref:Fe2OG dioxygenase domain-containing protein n=1 Tax=Digitaria exilis TaxID=1010633 RepID=A0A835FA86_9POAL|nr:hypothetical protein HU200_015382 [Digitaria exilis]
MVEEQLWKLPPIVQELAAAGVREPPSRYMVNENDRPAIAGVPMPEPIPVVDLTQLFAGFSDTGDADEPAKLLSTVQNWGLFLQYSYLVNGKEFRVQGYGSDMVLAEDQILDWCDRLYLVVEPKSRRVSLWPTQPPSFRYTAKCREIADLVLATMAKLVGLAEGYFVGKLDAKATTYASPTRTRRWSPITIVSVNDTVNGLQVQGGDGVWYDVPIVPGALLVNVGDAVLSNGFFKSPVHRVVTNQERERVSVAMFYRLDPEMEIEAAAELVDERRPKRYGKTKSKDYTTRLLETFARGGEHEPSLTRAGEPES